MKEYTFESFKVNVGNRNAYETMLRFCEKSGPGLIFLTGPSCSGKTHLLKATQAVFGDDAVYITGNDFTDELVDTIRKGNSTADFKDKYKNTPCLLFDCFQYIQGRSSTMEEFLNILDYRILNGLKTVLASDIPINEFENTDDHITARIEKEFVIIQTVNSSFLNDKMLAEKVISFVSEGLTVFPLTDVEGNVTGAVGHKIGVRIGKSESCGYGFFGSFNTDKDVMMISDNFSDARIARSIGYDNVIGFLPGRDQETFTEEALCAIAALNKKIILKYGRDNFGRSWAEDLSLRMKEKGIEVYTCYHEWSERENISKFKKELDKVFAVAY